MYIYIYIYIYIYGSKFVDAESRLFLSPAQCFNTESMQKFIPYERHTASYTGRSNYCVNFYTIHCVTYKWGLGLNAKPYGV
jgi:hypothetical protein